MLLKCYYLKKYSTLNPCIQRLSAIWRTLKIFFHKSCLRWVIRQPPRPRTRLLIFKFTRMNLWSSVLNYIHSVHIIFIHEWLYWSKAKYASKPILKKFQCFIFNIFMTLNKLLAKTVTPKKNINWILLDLFLLHKHLYKYRRVQNVTHPH